MYLLQSSLEIPVDASMSSAFFPMQYSRVLTCQLSSSADRPDAWRNCSNRRFQRDHLSGILNSEEEGGCKRILAIPLLTPCRIPCRVLAVTTLSMDIKVITVLLFSTGLQQSIYIVLDVPETGYNEDLVKTTAVL